MLSRSLIKEEWGGECAPRADHGEVVRDIYETIPVCVLSFPVIFQEGFGLVVLLKAKHCALSLLEIENKRKM